MQIVSSSRSEWITVFSGLRPIQFRVLTGILVDRGGTTLADGRRGRQWSLSLPDRALLVAAYWRTNLTIREVGLLFDVSPATAQRTIEKVGPFLALAPVRKRRIDQATIMDGRLVPIRGDRPTPSGKRCRSSVNLQIAIDADTRLVLATDDSQPENQNSRIPHRNPDIQHSLGECLMWV
jgi:hypothetical protein